MNRTIALLLAAVAWLVGCAAVPQPQTVSNKNLSDATKARSFKSYREVLLVPPKADPQGYAARLRQEIEALGYRVRLMDPNKPVEGTQGTAFVIGADGWMLTCAHVVGKEKVASVDLNGVRVMADVVRSDAKIDLALLKLRAPLPAGSEVLPFRSVAQPAAMGEDVFTIGYPLSSLLGNSARMSRGLLSATAGLRDNPQEVQVSAQIHPGNSGGPLLDMDGRVIGVVHRVISPAAVQRATGGALPQNINFAVKAQPVLDFVKGADAAAFAAIAYDRELPVDRVNKGVAKVQAGVAPTDAERRDRLLVMFGPTRVPQAGGGTLPFVALLAADYGTREGLFSVLVRSSGADSLDEGQFAAMLVQFRRAITAR